ncbi:unnamed protein product [Peniophora sp. CBMAI 1063]|nr:unnamed protein product [Peniophora sp. CBMAI 1063]
MLGCRQLFSARWQLHPASSGVVRTQAAPLSISHVLRATWRDQKKPPPPPRFKGKPVSGLRARIDRINPSYIIFGFLGIYGVVFLAWTAAKGRANLDGNLDQLRFMLSNFALSWPNLQAGRLWVMITAAFSHIEIWHLAMNGFVFWSLTPLVIRILGNAQFLGLYVIGAVVSNVISLALTAQHDRQNHRSVGASGAMYCVATLWACCYPNARILLFFVIPCPAWGAITGVLAIDGYNAWLKSKGDFNAYSDKIDVAAHVGGILTGLAYYLLRVRFKI